MPKPTTPLPKLAALVSPIARPKKKPRPVDKASAGFLPWLDRNGPKELREWNALGKKTRLEIPYGQIGVARAYTFSHAVAGVEDDGCWLARVRAVFCALSPIAEEDEELHLASWWSYQNGTSVIWYTHQDEREIQGPSPSIASWLVERYERWDDPEELPFPKEWSKAAKVATKGWSERVAFREAPDHLAVQKLQPRTDWIVQVFCDITWGDGDPLADAATPKDWAKERALVKKWPHLQAYWLLHALVWDDREALPGLLAVAERRYPAVAELAGWAERVLKGKPIAAKIWDEERIRGFRDRAAGTKLPLLTDAARARLRGATKTAAEAGDVAAAERKKLALDRKNADALSLFSIAETFAGKIPAMENTLNDQWNGADEDAKMRVFLWNRRGNATLLRIYLWELSGKLGPAFRPFFEALVRRGADFAETHEKNVLGALTGLGVAVGDWSSFVALTEAIYGEEIAKLGRLRRLEVAVVAQRRLESGDAGGLPFLRAEAARWASEIDAWETTTALTSLAFLLRRKDEAAFATFTRMAEAATLSGANWSALVQIAKVALEELRDPALGPGLRALVRKGLGRHDDGERALVCRAWAACGAKGEELEKTAREKGDVRTQCTEAAITAGLIELHGKKHTERAKTSLTALLSSKPGSMELGAAISLLQAIAAKSIPGFADAATRVLAAAKKDKHTNATLRRWLSENVSAF